jgi:nucleoside 2-deoxyribosyltransferase
MMNVYFSANHRDIQKDIENYRAILDTVRSQGFVIANNWIEAVGDRMPPYESATDWTNVCTDARSGLDDADIVIAEASGPSSFGSGLEVGYAIAKKKKVILFVAADRVNDCYAMGLDRGEALIVVYTKQTLVSAVEAALRVVK